MNRDQIWQQIKNEKSEIYGHPMIDLFLQLTENLSEKHFLELDEKQREKLNNDVVVDLLYKCKNVEKISELLGKRNFNKLDSNQIKYLLSNWTKRDGKEENPVAKAILKYRDIGNDIDMYNVLSSVKDANDLKNILGVIGEEKLRHLGSLSISNLLTKYLNKFGTFGADEGFEMFKIFVVSLKENISNLEPKHTTAELTTALDRI
jgi:hypothetical protein